MYVHVHVRARRACAHRVRGAAVAAAGLPRSCVGAMFVRAEPEERVNRVRTACGNGKNLRLEPS